MEKEEGKSTKDVEELRDVLKAVREEIPGLLKDITSPLKELMGMSLTEEQARERARAIGAFYRELIASGMSEDDALELVKSQFPSPIDIVKNIVGRASETGSHKADWRQKEEEAK